jgi:DNA-binding MarR family transcriptional regulator
VNVKEVIDHVAVANRLRPILLKLSRELRRESHALGLTGGQTTLLVLIAKHPGIGARELAAREHVSPAAISGHLARLERAGLVGRRESSFDRRRQELWLTPEGERVLRAIKRRRTAWLATRLKRLTPAELDTVEQSLELLERLIEEEP